MRKIILTVTLISGFGFNALSQQADTIPPVELQRQVFVYGLATKYGDRQIAKSSLYNILSITPRNIAILDSLALLYFQDSEYASAALVSQDILTYAPDNLLATEIAAISFEALGVKDRAVNYYEKLYLGNNDMGVLYQASLLQYQLKRYAESNVNLDIILGNPESENQFLNVQVNQLNTQQIPMRAGVYRLKGMISQDMGDIAEAKAHYTKALELAPDFNPVKRQLEALN